MVCELLCQHQEPFLGAGAHPVPAFLRLPPSHLLFHLITDNRINHQKIRAGLCRPRELPKCRICAVKERRPQTLEEKLKSGNISASPFAPQTAGNQAISQPRHLQSSPPPSAPSLWCCVSPVPLSNLPKTPGKQFCTVRVVKH